MLNDASRGRSDLVLTGAVDRLGRSQIALHIPPPNGWMRRISGENHQILGRSGDGHNLKEIAGRAPLGQRCRVARSVPGRSRRGRADHRRPGTRYSLGWQEWRGVKNANSPDTTPLLLQSAADKIRSILLALERDQAVDIERVVIDCRSLAKFTTTIFCKR